MIIDEFAQQLHEFILSHPCPKIEKPNYLFAYIEFNVEEVERMSEEFAKQFISVGSVATCKKYCFACGDIYQIIYKRNGYFIEVFSTALAETKEKFIKATKKAN